MAADRRPPVAGVALGDLAFMTASMLGLGAVLAPSAMVFIALRWIRGLSILRQLE